MFNNKEFKVLYEMTSSLAADFKAFLKKSHFNKSGFVILIQLTSWIDPYKCLNTCSRKKVGEKMLEFD